MMNRSNYFILMFLLVAVGGCIDSHYIYQRLEQRALLKRERERERYGAKFKDKNMIYHGKIKKYWCGGMFYMLSLGSKSADELYEITVKDANKNGTPGEYLVDAKDIDLVDEKNMIVNPKYIVGATAAERECGPFCVCVVVTGTMASVKQDEPEKIEPKEDGDLIGNE